MDNLKTSFVFSRNLRRRITSLHDMSQRVKTVLRYRRPEQESSLDRPPLQLAPNISPEEGDVNFQGPSSLYVNLIDGGEDEIEAEVPDPFEYFEDVVPEEENTLNRLHKSDPLPQFYGFEKVPSNINELPPLEYYSLDPEADPVRLLVVLPHFGDPYSTVQCNLFPVSLLFHHYCYAAIRNTRGNKTLTSNIIVNCESKQVTRNLEVFLHHFRHERVATILWIREICIYAGDDSYHKTPEWREWIFNKACKVLNMPDFMETLRENGELEKEKQFTVRQKDWSKVTRDMKLPTHYPIPLRTFSKEELESDESQIPRIPHEYMPLDLVAEEIRLVVLLPSTDPSAPLIAHFAYESIYGTAAYQCLSYTWGAGDKTAELTLNGQLFYIRQNLEQALRNIRQEKAMTVLWIDAVCIDQENIRERSQQVQRMHQIYKMADCVLIYLGEGNHESDIAMDFISELSSEQSIAFEEINGELKPKWGFELARSWAAVYRLARRPYFRRLWVVQEVAVASLPTAFCGTKMVQWRDLHYVALRLQLDMSELRRMWAEFDIDLDADDEKGKTISRTSPCIDQHRLKDLLLAHKFSYIRQAEMLQKPLSFLFLLLLNRNTECTDDRDKIYGLWNLANDAGRLNLTPDYSLSVRKLYITFAKKYIELHKRLDIICSPQTHCAGRLEDGTHLPSWCPDWRTGSHVNSFLRPEELPLSELEELTDMDVPLYRAARDTHAITGFFEDDECLVCAGMIMDEIMHTSGDLKGPEDWYAIAKKHCHEDGTPLSEERVNKDFWSMMFGDATSSWFRNEEGHLVHKGNLAFDSLRKTSQILPNRALSPTIRGRKLIITKSGFMGLAPFWVEAGQKLAVLLGCSMPVLLSPCGTHFHMKGDCFVQGWMKGELLDALLKTDEEITEHVTSSLLGIQIR